jgi:hypothetical protein
MLTPVDLDCVIAGWGLTNLSHHIRPKKLQVLQVKTGDWNVCKRQRPETFHQFHICAGIPGALNKAPCLVIKS